jgi:hypothetical protein
LAQNIKIFDDLARAFSDELPQNLGNMDEHLDYIIKHVRPYGEDLVEENFWIAKRWKELRDDATFHESILHIFNVGGEYLLSVDGNIGKGTWRKLGTENTIILEFGGKSELFDLRHLNNDFLVLGKHGDQVRKGNRKYFCLVREGATRDKQGKEIDWRNLMELLYNSYRSDSGRYSAWLGLILVIVVIILILSLG